jgi:F0F1-type ATP synthase assembly protein I
MTAPAPQKPQFGWYRSGAGIRSAPQVSPRGMNDSAWTITSRIIAGLLLYTGVGWLLSLWLGHQQVLMAVGALVGLGLSYTLVFMGLAREARRESASAGDDRGLVK